MKALEDLFKLVGRDAGSRVADQDLELTVVGTREDRHTIAALGVGDGVADEVAEDLGEPVGVGLECAVNGMEPKVAFAEQREVAPEVLKEVVEIDRLRLDHLSSLGASQGKHVSDQAVELVQAAQQDDCAFVTFALVVLVVE